METPKTTKEILESLIKMRGLISDGGYSCIGIPYETALRAMEVFAEQVRREERERNIELLSWIHNHSAFSNEMWIEEVCEKVEEALAAAGLEGKGDEQ